MPSHLYATVYKAYQLIGELTPLAGDCGRLCGGACCQGDDEVGMLLFPGEAARLAGEPGFRVTKISYMEHPAWLLTCDGTCDRSLRPLSCRIFPLAPHVSGHTVTALPDPRARRMCPLADGKSLDPRFIRAVNRAFTVLAQEPKTLAFMGRISQKLDELRRFWGGSR